MPACRQQGTIETNNEKGRTDMKHPIARYNRNNPRGMAALLLGLCLTTTALAGDKPNPGQSSAFGKSLAQWQDTYFRWFVGQLSIPPDRNGNADVGHVVLMPLPSVPGDGTPGH